MIDTKSMPLQFLVFSFNRGDFLKNCVDSIIRCVPNSHVTIWDDNSDDALTLSILDDLATTCDIKQPAKYESGEGKLHGGLYKNMQSAIETVSGNPLICTIQDDMQVVRPLLTDEVLQWHALYEKNKFNGLLHPGFIKRLQERITFVPKLNGYHINRQNRSAGAHYSDIFLTRKDVLLRANWHFSSNEAVNEQQAREKFSQMVYMKNPFVAWLPGVPAWRGRKRTWAMRVAERKGNCGFYPFEIMCEATARQFCERPAKDIPLAESYLTLSDSSLPKPWFYSPLQRRVILRKLNKIELRLTRSS
ncbi:MAG: glycosyltransferase [Pseudomonadota bacterium]|nr:glycosyltransferase [Pseudomonadota bacterium]